MMPIILAVGAGSVLAVGSVVLALGLFAFGRFLFRAPGPRGVRRIVARLPAVVCGPTNCKSSCGQRLLFLQRLC